MAELVDNELRYQTEDIDVDQDTSNTSHDCDMVAQGAAYASCAFDP